MHQIDSEEFLVPFRLDDLVKEPSNPPANLKRELKKLDGPASLDVFTNFEAFRLLVWSIDQIKESESLAPAIAAVFEQIFPEVDALLDNFFNSRPQPNEQIDPVLAYKKTACLVVLFLKRTLKKQKVNLLELEESKRARHKPSDPLFVRQQAMLAFLAGLLDRFGAKAELKDPELNLHILDAGMAFVSCALAAEQAAKDAIGLLFKGLLLARLVKVHEFSAKMVAVLEDAGEEAGAFFGQLVAGFLSERAEGVAEAAHSTTMRAIESLMTKKVADSPLFKNTKAFLLELTAAEPLYFYNNFGIFVILLGCENYAIRGCVCDAMLKCSAFLRERASADPSIRQKVLKFFEIVCERTRDRSSYARSAVLSCVAGFIGLNLLEDEGLARVFVIARERLLDTSSIVRRRAIVLLQELCLYFKNSLPPLEQLRREISKFEATAPQRPSGFPLGQDEEDEEEEQELGADENERGKRSESANSRLKNRTNLKSGVLETVVSKDERVEIAEEDEEGRQSGRSRRRGKGRRGRGRAGEMSTYEKWCAEEEGLVQDKEKRALLTESESSQPLNEMGESIDEQLYKKSKFYEAVYKFIDSALLAIRRLVFSSSSSDAVEALRLIYVLTSMEIPRAKELLFECFKLIWTKEAQIKEEILRVFHRTFVGELPLERVIENLIAVIQQCDENARLSVEEIVSCLLKRDYEERAGGSSANPQTKIRISIRKNLWEAFQATYAQPECRAKNRVILRLLRICAVHYPQWITENVESVFGVIKNMMAIAFDDFEALCEFTEILALLPSDSPDVKEVIIKSLIYFLLKFQGTSEQLFLRFIEKVVFIVFCFKKNPEIVCDYLLKRLAAFLGKKSFKASAYSQPLFAGAENFFHVPLSQLPNHSNDADQSLVRQKNKLVHLIFAAGSIALMFLFYFEKVDSILQMRRSKIQSTQVQNELEKAIGGAEAEYEAQRAVLSVLVHRKIFKDSLLSSFIPLFVGLLKHELASAKAKDEGSPSEPKNAPNPPQKVTSLSQNGSQGEFQAEDQEFSFARKKAERQNPSQLGSDDLGRDESEALNCTQVMRADLGGLNPLAMVALDALCKYMIVSPELCAQHLQFVFSVLETPGLNPGYGSNVIVYLGDLFHKHPNVLSPEMHRLFGCLKSRHAEIRRTAVTVLSHLILNDFVKLKAEVSDFVFLLEDEDASIVEIAHLFFQQLNDKDGNFIYNIMPDAISRLSSPEAQGGVSEVKFEKFARFFLKFIQKDRVIDHLVEKLVLRLRGNTQEKEIRNIVFCITCLATNDRGIQKINENAALLRNVLEVRDVGQIIKNFLIKLRKHPKVSKAQLDDLEIILFQNTDEIFNELKKRKKEKQAKRGRGRKARD